MNKSTFAANLLGHNLRDISGFRWWAFYPGMLFDATDSWWGSRGRRNSPHEGLDLRLYVDGKGESHALGSGAKIPAIYEGQIVKIDDDFLGKSIYVRHAFRDDTGNILFSVYGHTTPAAGIDIGVAVVDGDVIARISDSSGRDTAPPPHLHVSVVWAPQSLPAADLSWSSIGARGIVKPVDPLTFLELPHVLLP